MVKNSLKAYSRDVQRLAKRIDLSPLIPPFDRSIKQASQVERVDQV
jgi:cell fate (sporulation/competence/biofilm development) regulator YmcA (YheA/YmcA/DUF963 family)